MSTDITEIKMKRLDDHVHFQATSANGQSILMDGSPAIGGKNQGVRPMETLLMGVAGCSSIDVVLILKKMKQSIDDISVHVTAEKIKVDDHTEFRTINIHFDVKGDIKEKKLQQAIDMSTEKYCSVSKILEKSAEITTSYVLNGEITPF